MRWEEFKKDNPFRLTERQFKRILPYISEYRHIPGRRVNVYGDDIYPAKARKPLGLFIWVCNCGAKSRKPNAHYVALHNLRKHRRIQQCRETGDVVTWSG